jgi:alpha-tubulin suppressor-like RCC1 family protein
VAVVLVLTTGVSIVTPASAATTAVATVSATTTATAIAAGGGQTCVATGAGAVLCWGANKPAGSIAGAKAVTAGYNHACALTNAGAVLCWGDNSQGQLGDGTTTSRSTPATVASLGGGVASLDAGPEHTCAVTIAGAVLCWGDNRNATLGDGTTTDRLTPVPVSGLSSGQRQVAAGTWHTCALDVSGTARCWGLNDSGQLGDRTNSSRLTPVEVYTGNASGARFGDITAGWKHTCGVTITSGGLFGVGAVMCWGVNTYGQLGSSSNVARNAVFTPSSGLDAVTDARSVSGVDAGEMHTCAVMTSGGVRCWGYNSVGQLGSASGGNKSAPTDTAGLPGPIQDVAAGVGHTCALTRVGTVACWGANDTGQLGDGTIRSPFTVVDACLLRADCPVADLSVQVEGPPAVTAGDLADWTVTVRNAGSDASERSVLQFRIPPYDVDRTVDLGVFTSVPTSPSCFVQGTVVTCSLGTMQPLSEVVLQFQSDTPLITAADVASWPTTLRKPFGDLFATATVWSRASDPNLLNNEVGSPISIQAAAPLQAQVVAFTSTPPSEAVVGGSYVPTAAGGASGSPVTFVIDSTSTTGACAFAGGLVSFTGAGTCVLNADQAGSSGYSAAPRVQQSFTIGQATQAVAFTSTPPAAALVGGSYTPTATGGGSGNPVTFSLDAASSTGACTFTGGLVSFTGAGTCVLNADQAGSSGYSPAPRVQQSFTIGLATQVIAFTSTPPTAALVGGTYTPTATGGGSDNPVTFSIDSASTAGACTLTGTVVSFTGAGRCVINADQAGTTRYEPAPQAQQSFTIDKVTILVTVSGTQTYGGAATFTRTSDAPPGVSLTGALSCTAVGAATTITPALAAGSYTVAGASCTGLASSMPSRYTVRYAGATDGFVVSRAATTLNYTGQQLILVGATSTLTATLTSGATACVGAVPVAFSLDADPFTGVAGDYLVASATTDALGKAVASAVSTTGWLPGVYTVTAAFAGGTSCAPSSSSATFTVASPGDAAHGGGWYSLAGSGRVNAGFTVRRVQGTTSTYTGQLRLLNPDRWKLEGTFTTYGTIGTDRGTARGNGDLSWWNPTLRSGRGDWQLARSGVAFAVDFTASSNGKRAAPGSFGIQIQYTPTAGQPTLPNSIPQPLKAGTIKVS